MRLMQELRPAYEAKRPVKLKTSDAPCIVIIADPTGLLLVDRSHVFQIW